MLANMAEMVVGRGLARGKAVQGLARGHGSSGELQHGGGELLRTPSASGSGSGSGPRTGAHKPKPARDVCPWRAPCDGVLLCPRPLTAACLQVREIEKDKLIEAQKIKSEMLYRENNQLIRALDCFK